MQTDPTIPHTTPIETSGHFFNGSASINTSLITTTGSGTTTGSSSITGMRSALHRKQLVFSGGFSSLQSGHDCDTRRVLPATPGNLLRAISVSRFGR
jgi:hypothetical protein